MNLPLTTISKHGMCPRCEEQFVVTGTCVPEMDERLRHAIDLHLLDEHEEIR